MKFRMPNVRNFQRILDEFLTNFDENKARILSKFALITFARYCTSYFFAYREFMPPKHTTCNSLRAYNDMATNPENSNFDLSPVSPELSCSSSTVSASIAPGSSSGPGLSLESLTASIVKAICPLLDSGRLNDQTMISSPSATTSCSFPGPSLQVPLHNYQLLLAWVGICRFIALLIRSPRQQCHRSAFP